VISHFHGDHVPLTNANPYQLNLARVVSLNSHAAMWVKSSSLSPTEKKRSKAFSGVFNNQIIAAEGKSDRGMRFSQPVPHGKAEGMEKVIMTRIQDDITFVHASDIQLLNREAISQIASWTPDIVLASGPPLYLHRLSGRDVENAWQNALTLSKNAPTLILDHHLHRDLDGAAWLDRLNSKAPGKVICSADFMGRPRMLLEARRAQLYKEIHVPEDWHDSYAQGNARTDFYWDRAHQLYAKKGINHYR
jgi:hypothetical protein